MKLLSLALLFMLTINLKQALADDFAPPDYRTGEERTTWQRWEFADSQGIQAGPVAPNDGHYGDSGAGGTTPSAKIDHHPGDGGVGDSVHGGIGVDGGDVYLQFYIPNFTDHEPLKYLRIQMTHYENDPEPPSVSGITGQGRGPDNEPVDSGTGDPMGSPHETGHNHIYEDWVLRPNPESETIEIKIPRFSTLQEIVIDTWSTSPEPASGVLFVLGLASFSLLRHRRRH